MADEIKKKAAPKKEGKPAAKAAADTEKAADTTAEKPAGKTDAAGESVTEHTITR